MRLRSIPKCVMSPNSKDAYQDMPFSSLVQRQPLASHLRGYPNRFQITEHGSDAGACFTLENPH